LLSLTVTRRNATRRRAHAVVLGEALIDEGVVGREQIQKAAVLAEDARHEQRGLGDERLPSASSKGKMTGSGFTVSSCYAATDPRSSRPACPRADRRHPPHLMLEHRRVAQLVALGEIEQSASGIVLHRKNDSRDASSTSLTWCAELAADAAGSRSMWNRNSAT
jgi:hypothetical protein